MARIALLAAVAVALLLAPSASAWVGPLTLSGADGRADVAVDADGTAAIAAGGTLPRLAQRARGGFFADPVAVAPLAPGPPEDADVAAAGHGALALAWRDGIGRVMATARDPGGPLRAPRRVSPGGRPGVMGPRAAVAADGAAIVAWLGDLDHGGRGRVYMAYRAPGGAFGTARRLTATRGPYPPALAMNAAGRAVVAWRRAGCTEAVAVERGAPGRPAVLGCPARGGPPVVAVAGDGAAVVAWKGRGVEAAWRAPRGGFRAPRALGPPRRGWAAGRPAVAAGPGGETAVAWREVRGPLAQVVAVRGRRGTPRVVRPLGPHRPRTVVAAIRADGAATVAWDQPRGGARTPEVLLSSAPRGRRFGAPRHVALSERSASAVAGVAPALASGGGTTVVTWTIPTDGLTPPQVRWAARDYS